MESMLHDRLNPAPLALALFGLVFGFALLLTAQPDLATIAWAACPCTVGSGDTAKSLEGRSRARRRGCAVDVGGAAIC